MDELIILLNNTIKKLKIYLCKLYNKLSFLFNKQITLQKMYEPLITNKSKVNKELLATLTSIKKENKDLYININKTTSDNKALKSKIALMQELLIKK